MRCFSDGRANVPLGGEAELTRVLAADGDARGLAATAAEQCRTLAARLAGRAATTFVNLDEKESSALDARTGRARARALFRAERHRRAHRLNEGTLSP